MQAVSPCTTALLWHNYQATSGTFAVSALHLATA